MKAKKLFPDITFKKLLNKQVDIIYPVGSIYMSVNDTSPTTLFGGTWERIAQGKTLWGADDTNVGGTEIEAGLPNITGEVHSNNTYSGTPYASDGFSGAFKTSSINGDQYYLNGRATGSGWYDIALDASLSNPIYGNSDTVQPPALVVYMWKRIN